MNTEFKPKLITLRSSGEKIPDQDPAVTSDQVDDIVNSSQKNLEGVQSALQLRKFRYIRQQNISKAVEHFSRTKYNATDFMQVVNFTRLMQVWYQVVSNLLTLSSL